MRGPMDLLLDQSFTLATGQNDRSRLGRAIQFHWIVQASQGGFESMHVAIGFLPITQLVDLVLLVLKGDKAQPGRQRKYDAFNM